VEERGSTPRGAEKGDVAAASPSDALNGTLAQSHRITLALLRKRLYPFGDQEDRRIGSVNKAQLQKRCIECGRQDTYLLGSERALLIKQKMIDRHGLTRCQGTYFRPRTRRARLSVHTGGKV
jgi:hypothetical protein